MRNKLTDLNDYLFATLENLNQEDLSGEEWVREKEKAQAVAAVGTVIVQNAALALKAHAISIEWESMSKKKLPVMLDC